MLALPLLVPLGLVVALMVFLDSPGPLIYRCRRIGLRGEPFAMLKFRKMCRDAAGGPLTADRDPRFTPIGRFLTVTRLDELPQVWNIVRGEMRLVGPRPETPYFVHRYSAEYDEILSVAPGLTGLAQLRFAGERHLMEGAEDRERRYQTHILPRKLNLDLAYVRTHNLSTDVTIIAATALLPLVAFTNLAFAAVRRVSLAALAAVVPATLATAMIIGTFVAQA